MKNPTYTLYAFGMAVCLLISMGTTSVWSQNTSQNEVPNTNPAAQVPDEIPEDDASYAKGRSLFGQHCSACHALGKQIIGPALASVHNRRPLDWLVAFIQNSQHVIQEDSSEYAQQLFEQYNKQVMPNFEFLAREDILDILAYIKIESVSTTSGVSGYMSEETESVQEEAMAEDDVFSQKEELESQGVDLVMVAGGLVIGILLVVVILVAFRKGTKQKA